MSDKTITAEMVRKAKWKANFFLDLADGGYSQKYGTVSV